MATPYLQLRRSTVPSTMEIARSRLAALPVVVTALRQTAGRGRSGAAWVTAPRAVAASAAFRASAGDARPFSLMAGVAALRAFDDVVLKWPNDLKVDQRKVGGILVERSADRVVVGVGVNLFWPSPDVEGAGALFVDDPGERASHEYGALWAAELIGLLDQPGWPRDEYRDACSTLGREITWAPGVRGVAVDVAEDGALAVYSDGATRVLHSGAVTHVRDAI